MEDTLKLNDLNSIKNCYIFKLLYHCMIIAYSLLYFKVVVKQHVATVCLHFHKRL